jgi:hypothetical protein
MILARTVPFDKFTATVYVRNSAMVQALLVTGLPATVCRYRRYEPGCSSRPKSGSRDRRIIHGCKKYLLFRRWSTVTAVRKPCRHRSDVSATNTPDLPPEGLMSR